MRIGIPLLLLAALMTAAPHSTAQTAGAAPSAPTAANRIVGYTAWDSDYLYLAFQINKPTLSGKNTAGFSDPLQDDCVIVSLQMDNDHRSTQRTVSSALFAASAVGGAQLYRGATGTPLFKGLSDIDTQLNDIAKISDPAQQELKRTALLASIVKFQVHSGGSPRVDGSPAPGYTVEAAIPWSDLGGKPAAGTHIGFNVAARSITPDSPALQSLSPQVRSLADTDDPSKWGEMVMSDSPLAPTPTLIAAPRVVTSKPVIDGVLSSGEWDVLSSYAFGAEAAGAGGGAGALALTIGSRSEPAWKPLPPAAPVPVPHSAASALVPPTSGKAGRAVMALYDYHYQADPRRRAPLAGVITPSGGSLLVHHPYGGSGPWFSYDRADDARLQLQEMAHAGVDVALVQYLGEPLDGGGAADKGLTVMTEALQWLRSAGHDYPQVAMYLDTRSAVAGQPDAADLGSPAGIDALYGMIRDFYFRVPDPFRYLTTMPDASGGHPACVVILSDSTPFTRIPADLASQLRQRFAGDFAGRDLVILGAATFKGRAALNGYLPGEGPAGFAVNHDGMVSVATIKPGTDTSLEDPAHPAILARREGDTYRANWASAIAAQPDWAIIDSWNDYSNGSEVAPTIENGYTSDDLTRVFTRMFDGAAKASDRILWQNAPSTMIPGEAATVHVRCVNTGSVVWSLATGPDAITAGLSYRWLQNGQLVATGPVIPFRGAIAPGMRSESTLTITASGGSGGSLPPGSYQLEIGVVWQARPGGPEQWIDETNSGATAHTSVVVAAAEPSQTGVTLVSTDMHLMPEAGGLYSVNVVVRNDGAAAWPAGAQLAAVMSRYSTRPPFVAERAVPTAGATAALGAAVAPGQEVDERVLVPFADPAGDALRPANPAGTRAWAMRWQLTSPEMPQGAISAPVPFTMVDFDFGVQFIADGTPNSLPADHRLPIQLSIRNVGPQTWKQGQVRVGYHWYYLDGSEFLWEDETTPIEQNVAPGGSVNDLLAWITAPPCDGYYYLVWDVKFGSDWASTSSSTRVFDETVHLVHVVDGRLTFVDLTTSYNLKGATADDNFASGDFDGSGRSFPTSLIPPYANADVTPSGVFMSGVPTGPDSPRRISFRWGQKGPKTKDFVVCVGQEILLGKSAAKCSRLHILAAGTDTAALNNLELVFQEPTEQSEDLYAFTVSPWDGAPLNGEEIGYSCPVYHSRTGVHTGALHLYHYVITIHDPRRLVAIKLPRAPGIKIAAITIEH
ncbi:MAG: hypothetical protein KGJ62_08745 [Armatimonadetes bacterium]|nr:hypothetical protein [Armatimonadota bacterium]MDE2205019.1 hypothetical protein [Armatimonadota bacterium]